MPRRRPEFETSEAGAEADKLKKFIDAGGFKVSGCPTQPAFPKDTLSLGKAGAGRTNFRITRGINAEVQS
jgi:hypothetical protein